MTPARKERLDKILVERGLCTSRAQAQALIMDGKVTLAGQPLTKPGTLIAVDAQPLAVQSGPAFVSRGGLKLEKALAVFDISVADRACIDVGASTGGFTDCLLQQGARWVAAVDVGYGQLDWKLRTDPRVQLLEKTNIRQLQPAQLAQVPSLGVVDTSFISLKKVLPPLARLLAADAEIVALLKPQFEYKDYLADRGFKGVVRGVENHQRVLAGVLQDLTGLLPDWQLVGLDFSPITGPKGNIEYLLHWARGGLGVARTPIPDREAAVAEVIARSYAENPPAS